MGCPSQPTSAPNVESAPHSVEVMRSKLLPILSLSAKGRRVTCSWSPFRWRLRLSNSRLKNEGSKATTQLSYEVLHRRCKAPLAPISQRTQPSGNPSIHSGSLVLYGKVVTKMVSSFGTLRNISKPLWLTLSVRCYTEWSTALRQCVHLLWFKRLGSCLQHGPN